MKSQIPFVRLGYLATIQSGITVDGSRDAGVESVTLPYLRVANVQDGFIDLDSVSEITVPMSVAQSAMLQRGDVLMTEGGDIDKLGRGSVWEGQIRRCLHQNHVFAVRPDQRVLHPDYLAYVTRTSYARAYFESTGTKTTNLASTSSSKIRDFRVPLPDIEIQTRVAGFLDAKLAQIDHLNEHRTAEIVLLSMRYQSLLSQVAQQLSTVYGTVRVRHVLQKIEQGWSPLCEDRSAIGSEWGVVKAGCINGGVFDITQHKALPADVNPELKYRLHHGDLLMSRASGSADLIGSIAVLPDDLPANLLLCDKIYRLQLDRTRMTAQFVAFMLRTYEVREQIKLGISGAEGMANNLPIATVRGLPLPNVPVEDQQHIVEDLTEAQRNLHQVTKLLSQQLATIHERKQALVTAVVIGQANMAGEVAA
jgi:type I restriction enzyme, S subunit